MGENTSLDVAATLQVFSNLGSKTPEAAKRVEDVLRLILNRESFMPADVEAVMQPLIQQNAAMLSQIQTTQQKIGELMADIKDVGLKVDQLDAKTQKVMAEIRNALDDALKSQITPEEMKDAVDQAIAATTASERAAAQAALDPIMDKLGKLDTSLTTMDDMVPDKTTQSPAEGPTTQPTESAPVATKPEETL
jgi:hypothetical protein